MENYIEQCVSGPQNTGKKVLYTLCWCATVLLVLVAIFLATEVVGSNPEVLEIKWGNLVLLVLCLAVAFFCFRKKDTLRLEYDYFYGDGALEISAVFNASRRKKLEEISMSKVIQIGKTSNPEALGMIQKQKAEIHRWFLNRDADIYYLVYMKGSSRHTALLELNNEMITAVRKGGNLPREAWQYEEGESLNHASLS